VAILLIFLPESPKFLLSQGDCEGALNIFRKIYHINTGKKHDFYPVSFILENMLLLM
jgi:VNT family MFS transporter (synaptic vesicle glycoprotein 2)